jgi:hypothetical protein
MNRFKGRPAQGLPGTLPEGETLLWQGAPEWRALARQAFKIRIVVGYFAVLMAARIGVSLASGDGASATAGTAFSSLCYGGAATAMFCMFAWFIARTTVYSITSKRVVITYGMALPKSINLPYSRIDAANLKVHADTTGDIALKLPAKTRLSYILLWPHARSGAQGRTEPVLRCVADAEGVASMLSRALGATLAETERATVQVLPVADIDLAHAGQAAHAA